MFQIEVDILKELSIGTGTQLRLVESIKTKNKSIQIYSPMSKDWHTLYRYDVENTWNRWEKLCQRILLKTKKQTKRGKSSARGQKSKKS